MPRAPHPADLSRADALARAEALALLRVSLPFARRALDDALACAAGTLPPEAPRSEAPHVEAVTYARGMVAAVRAAATRVATLDTPMDGEHPTPSEASRAVRATLDACAVPALAYAETDDTEAGRRALRTAAREAEACAHTLRSTLGTTPGTGAPRNEAPKPPPRAQ
jgi:hypothetical protein